MIQMQLNKIRIDEKNEEQVIVLKEKQGNRVLPIIIGILEVSAIKRNLANARPPRPMTHDLLSDVIRALGARLERIVIDKIEANTFYAKLVLKMPRGANSDKRVLVDARPSDSIALAIQVKAPIFVQEKVFEDLREYEGQLF